MRFEQIHKFIYGHTNSFIIQLVRYGFVGGISFVVDYGTLFCLTEYAELHYLLSATIAFVFGLITNYLLSISWVFSRTENISRLAEFTVFTIIGIVGLALNAAIMYACTEWLHWHYMLSKIISTILVFFWNFLSRKYLLFTKPQK